MTTVAAQGTEKSRQYPDEPRVGVGAVVFHDGRVLLVRRGRPPAVGAWSVPGGRLHLGESLQQAAEREILEETAITIRAGKPVFTLDTIDRDEEGRVRFHYVIVDLSAEYLGGTPQGGDDALEARWVSENELDDLQVHPLTRRLLFESYGFGPPAVGESPEESSRERS